jgi:alpha-tubulin suppressor-like RCC1 family protein
VQVAAGWDFTVALADDGAVYSCGTFWSGSRDADGADKFPCGGGDIPPDQKKQLTPVFTPASAQDRVIKAGSRMAPLPCSDSGGSGPDLGLRLLG